LRGVANTPAVRFGFALFVEVGNDVAAALNGTADVVEPDDRLGPLEPLILGVVGFDKGPALLFDAPAGMCLSIFLSIAICVKIKNKT
jgi:hypothetical protein